MPEPARTSSQPLDLVNYRYDFGLFERFGVELEYMIVDGETLNVKPITDQLMQRVAGEVTSDVTPDVPGVSGNQQLGWCNELVMHVVEFRPEDPFESLVGVAGAFDAHVRFANEQLSHLGARLLPGGMHPWMEPLAEMKLWPHANDEIYTAFDRIFDCRGHGWANLQSTHINLPFANDEEFGRLHAAIRLVLPLIPAMAASSPIMDGRPTATADNRLSVYRHNAKRVPSVSGKVIPEAVFTRKDYEDYLLKPMYRDIAPLDPNGILQHEWLNARGAIARFDRGAIEIRVMDIQECPAADLAIVSLIVETVRALTEQRWGSLEAQQSFAVDPLHNVLLQCIDDAEGAIISDAALLQAFGVTDSSMKAGELWQHLAESLTVNQTALQTIFEHGTLATRLTRTIGDEPDHLMLQHLYDDLADCLNEGRMYVEP